MSTADQQAKARQAPEGAGWQLEGSSAEAYERYAVPAWARALAEQLVELASPERGERVLDVACGTGIVARLAAERVGERGSVCGLDLNEGMLAVARAASAKVSPPIEWRHGDAAAMQGVAVLRIVARRHLPGRLCRTGQRREPRSAPVVR